MIDLRTPKSTVFLEIVAEKIIKTGICFVMRFFKIAEFISFFGKKTPIKKPP